MGKRTLISEKDVEDFLREFKKLAGDNGERIHIVGRRDMNKSFVSMSITESTARDVLISLEKWHYVKGPEKDRDQEGMLWFFCKDVNGSDAYIKVKIEEKEDGKKSPKCLSFHPYDGKPNFPFGGKNV